MKRWLMLGLVLSLLVAILTSCTEPAPPSQGPSSSIDAPVADISLPNGPIKAPDDSGDPSDMPEEITLQNLPPFAGSPYVVLGNNCPLFTPDQLTTTAYEAYAPLDDLGRCGVAMACIGRELMPTEDRGEIGQIRPSGWQTVKYDIVNGKYLYNRCHLIGFQLSGENANPCNLITGTRYLNVDGMLPFENLVADYVKETGHHVLYRVTPRFVGDEPVARGVTMEGYSVEDQGDGICFFVYVYNNQPHIVIDYATGDSRQEVTPSTPASAPSTAGTVSPTVGTVPSSATATLPSSPPAVGKAYVLNTSTRRFHLPSCHSVDSIAEKHRQSYTGERDALLANGYTPCGICRP